MSWLSITLYAIFLFPLYLSLYTLICLSSSLPSLSLTSPPFLSLSVSHAFPPLFPRTRSDNLTRSDSLCSEQEQTSLKMGVLGSAEVCLRGAEAARSAGAETEFEIQHLRVCARSSKLSEYLTRLLLVSPYVVQLAFGR